MRKTLLLTFALLAAQAVLLLSADKHAQATTQQDHVRLAQIILSCREQANVWYLQWTSLRCNQANPPRDKCDPIMKSICDLADRKCASARVYCTIKKR